MTQTTKSGSLRVNLMGRKAEEPLEKKDVILFLGDWDRLATILAPRKVKPTVFIRRLVRRTIESIEARAALMAHSTPDISSDDLDIPTDEPTE
jgi:hypothetical protein